MKTLFFLLMFAAIALTGNAQKVVAGLVYEDLNRNQHCDTNERGIAGIPVSNGQEVVLSDKFGKYELPIDSDEIIFVIKPADYKTPIDQNNLPLFYYNYKPSGSPQLKYAGVQPTGVLPKSLDFALYKEKEDQNFNILLFGDPQVLNLDELSFFDKRIVSELVNVKNVSFGISLGDEVGNNPDLFTPYTHVMKKIGVPWYNVIGNHDLNHDAKTDPLSDESFEKAFGPSTYSFNQGKVHFIILKDILSPDPRGNEAYWGGLTEKQFAFLENDLSFVPRDFLIVLAFHIPIWEGYVTKDIFRDEDRDRLFSLLKDFPNTLSISAHSHIQINKLLSKKDGWMQDKPHQHLNLGTTCGSWYRGEFDKNGVPFSFMSDGTPQGYAFLSFNKNQFKVKYKAAGFPEDYQMNIYKPKVISTDKSLSSLYVNFFIGNEKDIVKVRIDEGSWKSMQYSIEFDPAYLKLLYKWDFTDQVIPGRRPVEARECYHLWKSILPSDLGVGEHVIEIKATDVFGKTYTSKSKYRIAKEEVGSR